MCGDTWQMIWPWNELGQKVRWRLEVGSFSLTDVPSSNFIVVPAGMGIWTSVPSAGKELETVPALTVGTTDDQSTQL